MMQVFLAYQFAGTLSTPPLPKIYPSLFDRFSFARFLDFSPEKICWFTFCALQGDSCQDLGLLKRVEHKN